MSDSRTPEILITVHAWIFTAIVLLVLSACDPAQQEVEEQDKGAIAPTTYPESVVVPRSLSMAILEKEESGEWTSEKAVLTGLRILTGKEEIGTYFDPKYVRSESSGRIINRARVYLDLGGDESVKTEVRELLNLVFPPIDKIERFTVPKEKRVPEPSSRFWLDLLIPSAHAIPADCVTAWHAAGSTADEPLRDGIDMGADCFESLDRPRINPSYRYFYPVDWVGKGQQKYVDMAEEALTKSISIYRGLGLPSHTIIVIFIPDVLLLVASDDYAVTSLQDWGVIDPKTCMITVHESAWTELSDTEFKFTIAHEVFHCEQDWEFRRQNLATGSTWWAESTAEYFANVVYPCSNGEQDNVSDFDRYSNNSEIFDFDYENVVFFQFLANEIGNEGVLEFIRGMPVAHGMQPQRNALANYPNILELYHRFGEQYLDRKIADSCQGTMVNVNPDYEYLEILEGNEEFMRLLRPFSLRRLQFIFRAGKYRIQVDSPADDAMETSAKIVPPGESWEDIPEVLSVDCGKRIDLPTLLTLPSNQDTVSPTVIKISREGVQAGVAPDGERGIDRCLVGRWQIESDSMETMGNWMAPYLDRKFNKTRGVQSKTEYSSRQGSMGGRFTAGGRVNGGVTGLEQNIVSDQTHKSPVLKDVDIDMDITVTINSNSCAEYSADGNELIVWNVIAEDEVKSKVVSTINGKQIVHEEKLIDLQGRDFPIPWWVKDNITRDGGETVLPENLRFPYRCSGNQLEIDGPLTVKEGAPPLRFRKVASPE